jgi:hypothetical protein
MKCRWNRTMLNLCVIVVAIFEFIPDIEKFLAVAIFKMTAKIQHCPISSKFDMWVDNDVSNWFLTLKNFFQKSIRDIIIYLYMKFRWNRTMLNLCSIVVAILKMATGRNILISQHCSISKVAFDLFFKPVVSRWFGRLKTSQSLDYNHILFYIKFESKHFFYL